jgi:Lon protease-like protein
MTRFPFLPRYEALPQTLPVFPLPGAIVMPGSDLPLNIFEPRYLNMVEDALSTHRLIGMVQPVEHRDDRDLSRIGCAGRITQFRETADGRIELVLTGASRFVLGDELPTTRGYRMVVPDWTPFEADSGDHLDEPLRERDKLLDALRGYFEANELEVDWQRMTQLPPRRMLNSLLTVLPLEHGDKQTLLETVDDDARARLFSGMLLSASRGAQGVTRH